ncbi:MAG: dihydroorotate dehydrogenase electron transfer subunit [Chitinivibrionales bacterium]|nr:dihydroorotate dehydrogenase electron transfer subunit [Chitinivibrionales bacterium]MBD3395925.1 dihydroorotate dehydrogenase electron transfer subunit [Chitinivibrionales bacterium]
MRQFSATVVSNISLCRDLYRIDFAWDARAVGPAPGQFFTVRVSDSTVPLLRRPFAVSGYASDTRTASAIYQRRGRGTDLLAARQAGERLDVIGPLGNTFPPPKNSQRCFLAAGGIGLGPVLYLARHLVRDGRDISLVFGARTSAGVPAAGTFDGLSPAVCTDDGSQGFPGSAIDYLNTLEPGTFQDTVLYACGPMAMLKEYHAIAATHQCPCYVSIEQVMACGVGACMGCAIRVTTEATYARVCTDGPVFDSGVIVWT